MGGFFYADLPVKKPEKVRYTLGMTLTPSQHIDHQIAATGGWRGEFMKQLRDLIHQADPEITENWKWDTGVWTDHGMVCAVSPFKSHVKINFFQGVKLADPKNRFNSGIESKQHRGLNLQEGDKIPTEQILLWVKEAVRLNRGEEPKK